MDRQGLYNMYNGTSTIDKNTGDIETYEHWLERQLIARVEKYEQ